MKKLFKIIFYAVLIFLILLPDPSSTDLNLYGKIYEFVFITILLTYFFKYDFHKIA